MRNSNPFYDIIFIAVGIFYIGFNLYKDKVNSISDLKEIRGTLYYYSFTEDKGYRNHTYSYYIYLNEYLKPFQITADMAGKFDRVKFENTIKKGDSLKMLISKNDYYKIGSREKTVTFGIENDKKEFLNAEVAISSYNSESIIFGFVFIIVGSILLYLDIKRRKKKKIEEERAGH